MGYVVLEPILSALGLQGEQQSRDFIETQTFSRFFQYKNIINIEITSTSMYCYNKQQMLDVTRKNEWHELTVSHMITSQDFWRKQQQLWLQQQWERGWSTWHTWHCWWWSRLSGKTASHRHGDSRMHRGRTAGTPQQQSLEMRLVFRLHCSQQNIHGTLLKLENLFAIVK